MKKALIWTVSILLLIALAGYAFLWYRQWQALQTPVPSSANSLIELKVDQMLRKAAWNALGHPAYYWRTSKQEKSDSSWHWHEAGFSIPSRIYAYGLPHHSATTLFASLEVNNVNQLKDFVQKNGGMRLDSDIESGTHLASGVDSLFTMIFDQDKAYLCYSWNKEDVAGTLRDLIQGHETLPASQHYLYNSISEKDHDAVYGNGEDIACINFNNGVITFDAVSRTALVHGSAGTRPKSFSAEHNIASLWLDADIDSLISKNSDFLANYGIPADTLMRYYGDYLDVEWKDNWITQTDTIISYGYSEQLKKTEQQQTREKKVPEFYVTLKASPHLANYIPRQVVYKLNTALVKDTLFYGTGKQFNTIYKQEEDPYFFSLWIDFNKIRQGHVFPKYSSYISSLTELEVKAQMEGPIKIKGNLTQHNASINALVQLWGN